MRILVTGGTGFIGSHLTYALLEDGHEIDVTGSSGEDYFIDVVKDYEEVSSQQYDVVFHQAARNDTQCQDREAMMEANVYAPIKLFEQLKDNGCKKFIFASSTAVYGGSPCPYIEDVTPLDPLTFYAESKIKFEEWAMEFAYQHDLDMIGLRYCNVYGPGEYHKEKRASMIFQMWQLMKQNIAPKLFPYGTQRRDWIYVADVVKANILAMKTPGTFIVNCGSGHSTAFSNLVNILNENLNTNLVPEWIPNGISETYQSYTCCDMKKAGEKLAFFPSFTIESGIKEMLKN